MFEESAPSTWIGQDTRFKLKVQILQPRPEGCLSPMHSLRSSVFVFGFSQHKLWRSRYVRIIGAAQNNITQDKHGFHITFIDAFIHLLYCCLHERVIIARPMKPDIIILRKL